MDPLYANLDKRNNSADQPQTPPAPQPTAYSMPNFGQPMASSTTPTGPIVSNPSVPTPNATVPTTPIMSTPTRPTTSGTGDIILNIDQPKKSRKGLIFVITAALVIITIAAVIFLVPQESGINSKRSSFNAYVNYLLYGTESTADIKSDYEFGYRYYVNNIESKDVSYIDSLVQKYKIYAADDVDITKDDYYSYLVIFTNNIRYPIVRCGIIRQNKDKDVDGLRQNLTDYYKSYINSDSEFVQRFGNGALKTAEQCIDNDFKENAEIIDSENAMKNIIEMSEGYIIEEAFQMKEYIYEN